MDSTQPNPDQLDQLDQTPDKPDLPMYWMNLLSGRYWLIVGAWTIVPYITLNYFLPTWLAWVLTAPVALMIAFASLAMGPLDCPKCKKNFKVGAERCHHCSYDITEQS